MFGRGTSFYRWNTKLSDLGFKFKEEIIWNKGYCTSPLMRISRIHETISILTKGKGTLNKVKVPYLKMKKYDIASIMDDIKRMSSILHNPKSLIAVENFLRNNIRDTSDRWKPNNISISSNITKEDRCVSVARSMAKGCNEKSIIRTDREDCDTFTKFAINTDKRKTGDRCCNVMQSIDMGLNEKSIIKEPRDHYTAIHPTQKPVRLLERLLNLVLPHSIDHPLVIDPFSGSASSLIAASNLGCNYIGFEIDKEYFDASEKRIHDYQGLFKKESI
jgi:site-specific DNA-methyltransferase (adenine-specific)